jgi:hypothetical protein
VVELPVLRSLSIRARHKYGDDAPVESVTALSTVSVTQLLKLPNVEELDLNLAVDERFKLEKLLPQFNDYARLKKFNLYIFTGDDSSMGLLSSPLITIFARMRNLKELQLGADETGVPLVISEAVPAPPLRSLRLWHGSKFNRDSLLSVIRYLQRSPHWNLFESLRIPLCPQNHESVEWYSSLPPHEVCEDRYGVTVTFNHGK